jgi:hypothetical protein
MVKNKVSSWNL